MTRLAATGAALLALAACNREAPRTAQPDIGKAASEAQADIDNYAALAGGASPSPRPTAAGAAPGGDSARRR